MNSPIAIDVAVLGAVSQEVEPLREILEDSRDFEFHGETFCMGRYNGARLLIGSTGLGKVNAAITTAALLAHFSVSQMWNVGCAGAYSEGPLHIGDVLMTTEALCGHEGILTQNGVVSSEEIGIPILVRDEQRFYDRIPLHGSSAMKWAEQKTPPGTYRLHRVGASAIASLLTPSDSRDRPSNRSTGSGEEEPFQLLYGPSLTVGMVSGDLTVAAEHFRRYEALAENMEGSAIAQASFRLHVPLLECRGISNIAGDRNKRNWQMDKAIAHCHGIVMKWLTSR